MLKLSASQEDYLEAIYLESLKNAGTAKVTNLANFLNVKKASVTDALSTLSAKGLINYAPYSPVSLTDLGQRLAVEILARHDVMVSFFKNVLMLKENEAIENACKMEHIMSEELFLRIEKFSDFVQKHIEKSSGFGKELSDLYK